MIETVNFKCSIYPKFQSEGFAAKFAFPFAEQVCKGNGLDIGCNRMEWKFPNAYPIDPVMNEYNAMNIPMQDDVLNNGEREWDYIFSSHCLEHLDSWIDALDYWRECLKSKGVLFLYLPHPDQIYWRPWNNRKHKHILHPEDIERYLWDNGFKIVFASERDLNHSYMVMAEKI